VISIDTLSHFLKNFSWMMFENIVKVLVGLFVTIYVIRYLGAKDFGLLSYTLSIVGVLYPFSTLGIDAILFRNIIKDKESERDLIHTARLLRFIASIVIVILATASIYLYSENIDFIIIGTILLFGLIVDSFEVYKAYFSAIVKTKYIAISSINSIVIASLLKIVFVLLKLNVIWFAMVFVIQKIINISILKYFYGKERGISKSKYDNKIAKNMLLDSWPLIFTSFSGLLYMSTDQILIEYFLDFEQVGLYATAVKLIIFIYVIPSVISNIIYPKIIEMHKKLSKSQFIKKLNLIYFLNLLIALSILIFFMLFGEWIILTLFGEGFKSSVEVLFIYSFGLVFVFFSANNNKLLMMDNLQKLMLGRNVFGLILNIILNIILIPKYGINGAAFATVLTEIFILFSYGLNKKTRYIMYLQLRSFIYPFICLRDKVL
jgi:O-antigen/teichoic acid export membrane protein